MPASDSPSFLREPLHTSGLYELYLVQGGESPEVMQELGRARAQGFSASGQGTGSKVDLSPEDGHYHHLILWHRQDQCIAGAYRLGILEEILSSKGPEGLYLNSVFDIQAEFYSMISPAIELSRSFILPQYQRDSQGLALLWKGLGSAANRFNARNLYGSVTMPKTYSEQSRSAAVQFLSRHFSDSEELRSLVRAKQPFHGLTDIAFQGDDQPKIEHLAKAVSDYEGSHRGIPPLMRYYVMLGAKFLDFHVEAAFGDALYCLLRVDLEKIPPAYRRRFL